MDPMVLAAIVGALPPTLMAFLTWRRQKPTSNGFAEEVKGGLTRIETKLDTHIADRRAHMPEAATSIISDVLQGAADRLNERSTTGASPSSSGVERAVSPRHADGARAGRQAGSTPVR